MRSVERQKKSGNSVTGSEASSFRQLSAKEHDVIEGRIGRIIGYDGRYVVWSKSGVHDIRDVLNRKPTQKQEEVMKQVNDEEDDYRKRAAEHRKEKLSKGLFKLPEGETKIRILKTPKDEERNSPSVWIEYYVHRNVGPKKLTLRCGKSVIDDSGPCWLCKVVKVLKEKGKTKMAALLERQKVYAVQVAVWDEDISNLRGPLLWPMPSGKSAKSISFKVETIVSSKKDYLNHKEGYNFTFERQGTGMMDTVYGKTERDDEPSAVPKQIVAKLKPFADVVLQYDPEAQKNAYYGKAVEDEEEEQPKKRRPVDEDEDEAPTPKKKKPAVDEDEDEEPQPKKKPVVDDDDELEEPAPKKRKPAADDEEEDEPKPKKKKPAADDDEEELNFPEDEEEETEAPSKKKPKPAADEEEDFGTEDDDEAPTPKKKKPAADLEEDDLEEAPTPKKKKPAVDDDDEAYLNDDEDEAPTPKKKKPAAADDDDDLEEPAPKKRRPAPVEDDGEEEEVAPPKKKKPVMDDDEDV
jgi:hypothetical protein